MRQSLGHSDDLPNGTVLRKGTTFEVAIQPANLHNPKLDHPADGSVCATTTCESKGASATS
jgi:hypothetical protein